MIAKWKSWLALFAFPFVMTSTAAHACLLIPVIETDAEKLVAAKHFLDSVPVVVDGMVTKPQTADRHFATVTSRRILKGPKRATFIVESGPSCDIPLTRAGQKGRFILHGGPDSYRFVIHRFPDELLDQLLGSRREADDPRVR